MKTKHLHLLLFFTLIVSPCWSQISGVVNLYAQVTAIQADCGHLTLASTTGYNVGDRVLLIQMKGAVMNTTASAAFGDITSLNDAGAYEFNYIDVISGNDVFLSTNLTHTYSSGGALQLIQVPVYSDVSIDGMVTALPWDGSIGGVVAIEVTGTLTLNAGIKVSGLGFRGGIPNPGNTYSTCTAGNYAVAASSDIGGGKGEGIAAIITGSESGRGKQVNGGGGGLSNNTGGGGGGNAATGGIGGIQSTGCGLAGSPGIAGIGLTYSNAVGHVYLGGGGGGGQQNNLLGSGPAMNQAGATAGGYGGGIVIIRADKIDGTSQLIEAKGTEPLYLARGDSGGGGGGGGAVLISYNTLLSGFSVNISGGKGGDVDSEAPSPYTRRLGPGGGGGGGAFWTSKSSIDPLISVTNVGGTKGICGYTSYPSGVTTYTLFPAAQQTAVDGTAGLNVISLVLNDANASCSPLPVSMLSFSAKQQGNVVVLNWTTASERDNAGFIVQRSSDGVQYYTVNEVPATSCQQTCSYSCTDNHTSSGKIYYKLIQKDLNGTLTNVGSTVVEINSDILTQLVYPQPASDILYVELKNDLPVNLKLVDITGREQVISFTQQDRLITLQLSIPPGMYTLWLNNQEYAETIRVVVQ